MCGEPYERLRIRHRRLRDCNSFDLFERALLWRFVGSPAQQLRAMPKPSSGHMIVTNFNDEFWFERLPIRGSFGRPPAGTAGRIAGKTRRRNQLFQPGR